MLYGRPSPCHPVALQMPYTLAKTGTPFCMMSRWCFVIRSVFGGGFGCQRLGEEQHREKTQGRGKACKVSYTPNLRCLSARIAEHVPRLPFLLRSCSSLCFC